MEPDYIYELKRSLVDQACRVVRSAPEWRIVFGELAEIWLPWPWRIVANGRVAFGSDDDGQWFGLSAPLDGEALSNEMLSEKKVRAVSINEKTGDIHIRFDDVTLLEAFTSSRGYEGWRANFTIEGNRWSAIVLGGGEIAIYPGR